MGGFGKEQTGRVTVLSCICTWTYTCWTCGGHILVGFRPIHVDTLQCTRLISKCHEWLTAINTGLGKGSIHKFTDIKIVWDFKHDMMLHRISAFERPNKVPIDMYKDQGLWWDHWNVGMKSGEAPGNKASTVVEYTCTSGAEWWHSGDVGIAVDDVHEAGQKVWRATVDCSLFGLCWTTASCLWCIR